MKKLLALSLALLTTVAATACPPAWPRFATGPYSETDGAGLRAILFVGDANITTALTGMGSDTYDVLNAGCGTQGHFFAATNVFEYDEAVAGLSDGVDVYLMVRDTKGMTDYYGNYTEVYSVFPGVWWSDYIYYNSPASYSWDRHCSGGDPTFVNWIGIRQVDAYPDDATLVRAFVGNADGTITDFDAKYSSTSNAVYVLNQYVCGVKVAWDPTSINDVSYQGSAIPMTNMHRYWTANGKTNFAGDVFGWLVTDDPANPTSFNGSP